MDKRMYKANFIVEWLKYNWMHSNGLVQDCGIPSASTLEIPRSCTKPAISPVQLCEGREPVVALVPKKSSRDKPIADREEWVFN